MHNVSNFAADYIVRMQLVTLCGAAGLQSFLLHFRGGRMSLRYLVDWMPTMIVAAGAGQEQVYTREAGGVAARSGHSSLQP